MMKHTTVIVKMKVTAKKEKKTWEVYFLLVFFVVVGFL